MNATALRWASLLTFAVCFASGCAVGGGCHKASDCRKGLACSGPNDPPICGIGPMHGCTSNGDCGAPEVCSTVYDGCSASLIGSECRPPCTSSSCGAGMRCNSGGACEPIPCDEGFTCSVHTRCDVTVAHQAGPVFARTSGCVNVDCASDEDCVEHGNNCVNGMCHEGPGHCVEVMLVP